VECGAYLELVVHKEAFYTLFQTVPMVSKPNMNEIMLVEDALSRLDREWEAGLEVFKVRDRNGMYIPKKYNEIFSGIVMGTLFSIVTLIGLYAFLPFGLLGVGAMIYFIQDQRKRIKKASAYEIAKKNYDIKRQKLVEKLEGL
jgi:hypothetical protein